MFEWVGMFAIAATEHLRSSLRVRRALFTLKVLSATRISRIPKLFSTFIKNQIWICWCGEPNATSNFIFKLVGCPTCITEGSEALLWTSVVTDVSQYLAR